MTDEIKLNPIILNLDHTTALILVGQLQLALRHPQNIGPSSEVARKIAHKLQEALPEFAQVIEMGWDPQYDDHDLSNDEINELFKPLT